MSDARHRYDWWPKEKAQAMLTRLQAALDSVSEKGRLCIYVGDKDANSVGGETTTYLDVREGEKVVTTENDAFGCPPLC